MYLPLRLSPKLIDPAIAHTIAELFLLAVEDVPRQVRVLGGVERLPHDELLDLALFGEKKSDLRGSG